jgi:NAD(P)-dependent dehydrogenase (short-subunit alcohol dehydrogenase family)
MGAVGIGRGIVARKSSGFGVIRRPRRRWPALLPLFGGPADEDMIVGLSPHCTFNLNPRAPSIDRSVFPEDIAESIAFCATDRSAKSTGNILNVDAGNASAFTR